jgi:hypothetical protein
MRASPMAGNWKRYLTFVVEELGVMSHHDRQPSSSVSGC